MTKDFTLYITNLALIGIFSFICEASSSNGNKGLSNALKLVTSLCIFICVIYPLFSIIGKARNDVFSGMQKGEEIYSQSNNSFLDTVEDDIEEKLCDKIIAETGIQVHNTSIELSEKDGVIRIAGINVTIKEKDADKSTTILSMLKEFADEDTQITVTELENDT
ncbi:MAG: hypothetical protein E7600_08280 [Ruminococcaceae bacterium]|nr:hypothetical protein [Oscillospiraceae bacterium]